MDQRTGDQQETDLTEVREGPNWTESVDREGKWVRTSGVLLAEVDPWVGEEAVEVRVEFEAATQEDGRFLARAVLVVVEQLLQASFRVGRKEPFAGLFPEHSDHLALLDGTSKTMAQARCSCGRRLSVIGGSRFDLDHTPEPQYGARASRTPARPPPKPAGRSREESMLPNEEDDLPPAELEDGRADRGHREEGFGREMFDRPITAIELATERMAFWNQVNGFIYDLGVMMRDGEGDQATLDQVYLKFYDRTCTAHGQDGLLDGRLESLRRFRANTARWPRPPLEGP